MSYVALALTAAHRGAVVDKPPKGFAAQKQLFTGYLRERFDVPTLD
jgi:hypothetical protein